MNKEANTAASGGGIGFFGVLAILFITLKLCGVIDWSWWWVTCPIWGPPAAILALMALVLIVGAIVATCLFVAEAISGRSL